MSSAEVKKSENDPSEVIIVMLNIVHIKTDVSSSIDIILDRKIKNLDGIVQEHLRPKFKAYNEKNKYVLENDFSQVLIMDVLKGLREFGWKMLTSNAFMHFASEKMIETSFYFEKYFAEGSASLLNGTNALQPLLNYYVHSHPQYEETVESTTRTPLLRQVGGSGRSSSSSGGGGSSVSARYRSPPHIDAAAAELPPNPDVISPRLASLIMEKNASQGGPYGFMRRQSHLGGMRHCRLCGDVMHLSMLVISG